MLWSRRAGTVDGRKTLVSVFDFTWPPSSPLTSLIRVGRKVACAGITCSMRRRSRLHPKRKRLKPLGGESFHRCHISFSRLTSILEHVERWTRSQHRPLLSEDKIDRQSRTASRSRRTQRTSTSVEASHSENGTSSHTSRYVGRMTALLNVPS